MAKIYAMSDIQGCYDAFEDALKVVDFKNIENKLILIGDYIDRGPESFKSLDKVFRLVHEYPDQIIALKGNHEEWFLDFLREEDPELTWAQNDDLLALNSFIGGTEFDNDIYIDMYNSSPQLKRISNDEEVTQRVINTILEKHGELIRWVDQLDCYHECNNQIFVHAGISEFLNEDWKLTDERTMQEKYPEVLGSFLKDIVSGHIGTKSMWKKYTSQDNYGIFWDGENHYYIDGTTEESGHVNVLVWENGIGYYDGYTGNQIAPYSAYIYEEF
ncbi:serine/threonine protein phosphatase [Actinomycetota bacterium]|nr:serine/threonine protein phosphatase [Actinomycetota bacterium]